MFYFVGFFTKNSGSGHIELCKYCRNTGLIALKGSGYVASYRFLNVLIYNVTGITWFSVMCT